MVDELSGGKVMYAFLRVTDPNTQLPKNVLVNWVSGMAEKDRGTLLHWELTVHTHTHTHTNVHTHTRTHTHTHTHKHTYTHTSHYL